MKKILNRKKNTNKNAASRVRPLPVIAIVSLVSMSYLAGANHDRWVSYADTLFGVPRSSETLDLSSVQGTYQYLKANYDGEINDQALVEGANRGMVQAVGDVHTTYLSSDEAKSFNDSLEGKVGAGIGIVIGLRNDRVTVTRVLEDNPAITAGIKQGDIIDAVNGESTKGWQPEMASSKILGDPDTTVKLTILRGEESIDFAIVRKVINNPSVNSEVRDGIGIMTISRFDAETGALVRKAAEEFRRQSIKGIIVDVRSDGGGYLDAAVDTASVWLEDELIVTQKQRGQVTSSLRASKNPVLQGLPTVVLVNGGTASASEILAAALRDHAGAKIVGERTYGKGSVQQLIDLGWDGSLLKVTVGRWYTSDNQNFDGKGITPTVTVELNDEDANAGRDPQLDAALQQF